MVEHSYNPSGWRTRSALATEFKVNLDYKTVSQKGGKKDEKVLKIHLTSVRLLELSLWVSFTGHLLGTKGH